MQLHINTLPPSLIIVTNKALCIPRSWFDFAVLLVLPTSLLTYILICGSQLQACQVV